MLISKEWYKSKGMVAGIVLLTLTLKQIFDIDISGWEIEVILEQWTLFIASIVALYWRAVAKTRITK